MSRWFDDLDLDPNRTWLRMGLRRLGDEPWLITDDRRDSELELRARLLGERRGDVLAEDATAGVAAAEVLRLVEAELDRTVPAHPSAGPLERAGRAVQEDLCLLRKDGACWVLAAAVLCFPSRWRLSEKLGRSITDVHGPVPGYASDLARRVDTALDRLSEQPWVRRNWFVHPDANLFQPDRPAGGDPVVPADRCLDDLYLRSERQTLRRLPRSGWALFTIRVQQDPLREAVADDDRRRRFADYVERAPVDQLDHRGVGEEQAAQLRAALGR